MPTWTFDTGVDDWTQTSEDGTLTWQASGGVDGNGYISIQSGYYLGTDWYARAMSPIHLNYEIKAGDVLSFSVRTNDITANFSCGYTSVSALNRYPYFVIDYNYTWQTFVFPLDDYIGELVDFVNVGMLHKDATVDWDNIVIGKDLGVFSASKLAYGINSVQYTQGIGINRE